MKRSEFVMSCANNLDCNSDCEHCELYYRYLKNKEK